MELLDRSAGAAGRCTSECLDLEMQRAQAGADADLARTRALTAYKDFLALWKDADPDILSDKEAKAEYARMQ